MRRLVDGQAEGVEVMNGRSIVLKLAEHLRKYLLLYVILVILLALPVGYKYSSFFTTHKPLMKNIILSLAILTLYPSMVQLRAERFGSELRGKVKETMVGLLFIFGLAPLLAIFMASYIPHKEISIGFVAANAVPASSASIAYVLLAEGNIEFATLLAIISIIGALGAVPAYVGLYAKSIAVNLPLSVLGESVAIALLTPFILGQLTRYYLVKMRARKLLKTPEVELECKKMLHGVVMLTDPSDDIIHKLFKNIEDALECIEGRISKSIKPYLSLMTMVSMLILISLLIANKAFLLISKPALAGSIIGMQLVIYAAIIATMILASKALKLSYEDHMGMIFIALTKNESVAAAVSVLAIGAAAAVPAALVPAVQPVVAILYLSLAPWLRRHLSGKG